MQISIREKEYESEHIGFELEQSKAIQAEYCDNPKVPYICYRKDAGSWYLVQGCCNSWVCPRCGQIRARQEYGRMVHGAGLLAKNGHPLYFITLTCRGKDTSLQEAESEYLKWTNRLLSTLRARETKQGQYWAYVQVTERQKRQHPHSHMITTFGCLPHEFYLKGEVLPNDTIAKENTDWSPYLYEKAVAAGLGPQVKLSYVQSSVAVATYCAKYLFKESIVTEWPAGWRRVRYSHNYPKLPEIEGKEAFPLVRAADWARLDTLDTIVTCDSQRTYERSLAWRSLNTRPPKNTEKLYGISGFG